MKTKLMIASLSLTALALGSVAEAQGHGRGGHGGPGGRGGDRGGEAMLLLRAADANGDNAITRTEVRQLQDEMFVWMDRNGDGYLDQADQNPVRQRLAEQRAEDREDRHPRRGGRSGRGGPGEHRVDTDEDGRISQAEFLARENRLFEHLDENEDDVISAAELDAAVESRQERRFWWRD